MMYRKKPVTVDAAQWLKDGDHPAVKFRPAVIRFDQHGHYFYVSGLEVHGQPMPNCWLAVEPDGEIARKNGVELPFAFYSVKKGNEVPVGERPDLLKRYMECQGWLHAPVDYGLIETLEGNMVVTPGDWIITGVKGEHYPCKPDIFEATYEPAVVLTEADALADLNGTPRPDHPGV